MGRAGPGSDLLGSWAAITSIASLLYLALWALAVRIRIRRPRTPPVRRWLPSVSLFALLLAAGPSEARDRFPSLARLRSITPPWSEPDVFSPPHSSGRTGVESVEEESGNRRFARQVAARRPNPGAGTYHVRPGDSLWSIASTWLGTNDPATIARYWPLVYRVNRLLVGPNPNVIHPGMVLDMPVRDAGRSDQ